MTDRQLEIQKAQARAYELFLGAAKAENNFTPMTERKISEQLKSEGMDISCSCINRWKARFKWNEGLQTAINAALGSDAALKNAVQKSAANSLVKATRVTTAALGELLGLTYDILKEEAVQMRQKQLEGIPLSYNDKNLARDIARLAGEREDRMLDRLANAPTAVVTAAEVLAELKEVTIDIAEGADYEAEPQSLINAPSEPVEAKTTPSPALDLPQPPIITPDEALEPYDYEDPLDDDDFNTSGRGGWV